MLRSILLSASLILVAPAAFAQPSHEEIAAARLQYLDGDFETALKVIVPAAEAGDANAQNILGNAYSVGNGLPQDKGKALEWYEKSAAQEFDKAIYNLGLHYRPVDPPKAADYLQRAIDLGYAPAMYSLGQMHDRGQLTGEEDDEKAAELYQMAVDLGDKFAMNNLGLLYVYANGVEENMDYAFDLFSEAAELGYDEAIGNLGVMYSSGYGTPRDPVASMALYEYAAAMGNARAAINLAFDLILDGPEGMRDPATGWAWCQYGVQNSREDAVEKAKTDCDFLGGLLDEATKAAGEAIDISALN